jgi:outer membrane protein OmpA-like peptidoglycan-associated protein
MPQSAMKRFIFFALVFFLCSTTLSVDTSAQDSTVVYPNYVVIGAFAIRENAMEFNEEANKKALRAAFEINPNRNLYYVYVLTTDDRSLALEEAQKLRRNTKYFDSWVYSGPLGNNGGQIVYRPGASQDFNPETGAELDMVKVGETDRDPRENENSIPATPVKASNDPSAPTSGLSAERDHVSNIDTDGLTETGKKAIAENIEKVATLGPPPIRATSQPLTKEEVTGKDFYFYLFRGDNLATVDGEVDAIDFEKARRMATYQGNAPVKVIMPSGKSKQISFICQVFGYRKQQREYDPASPPDDVYLDEKGNLVVPFELSRLQKGDIAIMYNVFFFKDAAVMRPESRFEVTNLLEFLVENPTYKIMIHGHTNGNATGKIIRMDTPGNFYTLSGTKQGFGSAKELSEERARVIREFLIASGISPDRMDIRAWGGKKPIHDKHSVRASENVRVEIEILSQ